MRRRSVKKKKSAPKKKKRVAPSSSSRRRFVPMGNIDNIIRMEEEKKFGTGLSKPGLTDQTSYGKLFQVFNLIRQKQLELTVQQLAVLSYIGHVKATRPNEELTMMAIAQDLNFKGHTSDQRIIYRLGKGFNWTKPDSGETKKRDGLGFVELIETIRDPRQKAVELTAEGKSFLQSVEGLIKRNFATIN